MSGTLAKTILARNTYHLKAPITSRSPILRAPILLTFKSPLSTTTFKMSRNNADFEIQKLFDVKDRVALVTGGGTMLQNNIVMCGC